MQLEHIDHVTITVGDVERSLRFYREVLGLAPGFEWPGELTMLRCGSTYVAIAHWARGAARVDPPAITVDHFAFRVSRATYEHAVDHLDRHGVPVDHESDHGVCRSLYFRDPDGHLLELACYELGSGASPR